MPSRQKRWNQPAAIIQNTVFPHLFPHFRNIKYNYVYPPDDQTQCLSYLDLHSHTLRLVRFPPYFLPRSEIFNYIKFFYNPIRSHGNNDKVSAITYEKQYFGKLLSI